MCLCQAELHRAAYFSQFVLGLSQGRLLLFELGHGRVQLGPLWLHHPVDTAINLMEEHTSMGTM